MTMQINVLHFCAILLTSLCLFKVVRSSLFNFRPGYALSGTTIIATRTISSWEECMNSCLARSKCLSIEMSFRLRLCWVSSSDTLSDGVALKRTPGIWYSEKKDWNQETIDQRCLGLCSISETCFIRETAICQITECDGPNLLDNGTVILGSELSVGSKVIYKCLVDEDIFSVSICGTDGQWSLQDFTCPIDFVCPEGWEMFQESCYLFIDMSMSFTNAESHCRNLDARLVHVESSEENVFLRNYLSSSPVADYWIGMTDEAQEGQWKWYGTGTDVQFFEWYPGEARSNTHENCAVFGDTIAYTWADVTCGSGRNVICEMINPT